MARILVAYASRLGATRGIAERIGSVLTESGHEAIVQPVDQPVELGRFDAVVLGSGIFAGHWHKPALAFAREHAAELKARPTWLFCDGPVGSMAVEAAPGEPADGRELNDLVRPRDLRVFAGALDPSTVDDSDLSRFEKAIARRFIPKGDWRDWAAIESWARGIGRALEQVSIRG